MNINNEYQWINAKHVSNWYPSTKGSLLSTEDSIIIIISVAIYRENKKQDHILTSEINVRE